MEGSATDSPLEYAPKEYQTTHKNRSPTAQYGDFPVFASHSTNYQTHYRVK
jgi:hypothetical protein